jgi:hypothetical protein
MSTPPAKPPFRFFPTRSEAVSFIFFTSITFVAAASTATVGLLLNGLAQLICITIGLGVLSALIPLVFDALINRRELAHVSLERHDKLLAEIRTIGANAVFEAQAARRLSIGSTSNERMGLECAFLDDTQPGFRESLESLLTESKTLAVMMNYSPNWIQEHRACLVRRFADSQKETTFIFMDPRTPAFHAQAAKQGRESERLEEKLADSIRLLHDLGNDRVKIFGHRHFHVHHAIVGDRRAAVCGYFSAGEKQPSPAFFYTRTSAEDDIVARLGEDVRRVLLEADSLEPWFAQYAARNPRVVQ